MKKTLRFTLVSMALIGAYLLSACGGTLPQSTTSGGAPKVLASEIVFTGIVEQINGNQWVVSGQAFTVDPAAALDAGIALGDIVKVEGTVSEDGSVVALKIESSIVSVDNSNDGNANDGNSNTGANSNDDNSNSGNSNEADDNSNDAGDDDDEVFGVVEAITLDSITVGGVTYQLADFTEFKDAIAVGDQVKIHVIVNADGSFTIREIEKSEGLSGDDDNGNDDNSNVGNSNDDNGNDDNSNDDNGNDDNSGSGGGDDNSNDDNGNDD
jgi:hypothetical protein